MVQGIAGLDGNTGSLWDKCLAPSVWLGQALLEELTLSWVSDVQPRVSAPPASHSPPEETAVALSTLGMPAGELPSGFLRDCAMG